MYNNRRISVVISTYKEKGSIKKVIDDFFDTGFVDEVLVVNNNAEIGTDEEVSQTRARLVYELRQGYGHGYQKGIQETSGDYIVLCEADGTFSAKDIERFLVFAKDFPVVLGSRTNQSTLLDMKAMNPIRRIVDVIYAKVIEVIFATKTLTDIGCTYKLFDKKILRGLENKFKTRDSLFALELTLLTVVNRIPFVEIPVTFRERIGVSGTIPSFRKLIYWAIRIWIYIWVYWWRWQFRKFPPKAEKFNQ